MKRLCSTATVLFESVLCDSNLKKKITSKFHIILKRSYWNKRYISWQRTWWMEAFILNNINQPYRSASEKQHDTHFPVWKRHYFISTSLKGTSVVSSILIPLIQHHLVQYLCLTQFLISRIRLNGIPTLMMQHPRGLMLLSLHEDHVYLNNTNNWQLWQFHG